MNRGSVDHFLGIFMISFPLVAILKLGFKFIVNIDEVCTIEGVTTS